MAEQGFSKMARICKAGEDMDDLKRYLANSQKPWLLILDNADDPSLDILKLFPAGNRGTTLVSSRDPDRRRHATVGSRELREMKIDEAINLLLRSGDLSSEDQDLRDLALPIVHTLGYLALAVNHAGASIRQRICSLEGYLSIYTRDRKKLLSSQSAQAGSDYRFTVYTTWEISVASIKELANNTADGTAANALELLSFFGFCHFDDILENMLISAWEQLAQTEGYPWWASNLLGIIRNRESLNWDSLVFNQAIRLLSSYSLIQVSGSNNRISLHPLVHSWIRDSLNEELQLKWWNMTISTLASALDLRSHHLQRQLKIHLRHCIEMRPIDSLFLEDDVSLDRVVIASAIIPIYFQYPWKDGLPISERALEYSRRILGDECYRTCYLSLQLAQILNSVPQYQKAVDLLQGQVDVSIRVAGLTDNLTLLIMCELSTSYRRLGRKQEALELAQRLLGICEKSLGEKDEIYFDVLQGIALVYHDLGRFEEAVFLLEQLVAKKKEISNEDDIFSCIQNIFWRVCTKI